MEQRMEIEIKMHHKILKAELYYIMQLYEIHNQIKYSRFQIIVFRLRQKACSRILFHGPPLFNYRAIMFLNFG